MTKIKICGMRREEDIRIINRYLPDYAGFIMAPPFWRYTAPDIVKKLHRQMDPAIQAVGVFVDQDPQEIADLLAEGTIDIAQLHGHEDNAYIDALHELTDHEIWQACRIRSKADVEAAMNSHADRLLLDGGTGSGQTFDWSLLGEADRPFFLAGGLDADNVEQALKQIQPEGVDVSSGVESSKCKDEEKIRRFIDAVRR